MRSAKVMALAATVIGGLLSLALAAPAAAQGSGASSAASESSRIDVSQCRLVSFDDAVVVVSGEKTKELTLVVSGMRSSTNVQIKLVPVTYIQTPKYWLIEVIGCSVGIGLPVVTPYTVKLDVTHTVGTVGIEVLGSNGSKLIEVFPPTSK